MTVIRIRFLRIALLWMLLPATAYAGVEVQQDSTRRTSAVHRLTHPGERHINYGLKGGFTSALTLISGFTVNNAPVSEVENYYKIGTFGSLFMRVNFGKHFIQPEVSYAVNRSGIRFALPAPADTGSDARAAITSSIHSLELPMLYGYNVIKEGPYSLAIFGGPKLRYMWKHASHIEYTGFDSGQISERLHPFSLSATLGVAVSISPLFFDFRYDIGLTNLTKGITTGLTDEKIHFRRREGVLSFSLGVLF